MVVGFAATTFTLFSLALWSFKFLNCNEELVQQVMFPARNNEMNSSMVLNPLAGILPNSSESWEEFLNYTI